MVTLPGHRQPTPFLRLRCTGVPDEWVIGIYKATTEQYNENEFPWSYGPLTGTPEQGIDETLAPCAGPPTEQGSTTRRFWHGTGPRPAAVLAYPGSSISS